MITRYLFIGNFTLFTAIFAANLLSFLEECDPLPCPVDCKTTFPNSTDDCPKCECPMGARCPLVNCTSSSGMKCSSMRKMNGCPTCVCDQRTYVINDRWRNEQRFSPTDSSFDRSEEACRSKDMSRIDLCLRNPMQFMVQARLADPGVNSDTTPWFHFTQPLLEEMCDLIQDIPRCLGRNRYERCNSQEPRLQYLMTIFTYPCMQYKRKFFNQFLCIRNMMLGHYRMHSCEAQLEKSMKFAKKGKFEIEDKLKTKCRALNEFIKCSQPPLAKYCGYRASGVFREAILLSSSQLSPECPIVDGEFTGIRLPTSQNTRSTVLQQISSTFTFGNVRSFPSLVIPTKVSQSIDSISQTKPASISSLLRNSVQNELSEDRRPRTKLVTVLDKDGHIHFENKRDRSVVVHLATNDTVSLPKCGRVPAKKLCPTGRKPQRVLRWYRKLGHSECIPYQYSYCGRIVEERERPLKYEVDCYKYCFPADKTQSRDNKSHDNQHINGMVFENGFRIDDDQNQ